MGEIIHHDFGKPKSDTEIKKDKDDGIEFMAKLAGQFNGAETLGPKIEKLILALRKLAEMRTFIKSLRVVSTAETASLRADLVQNMSFEEKCDAIINSSENDWQSKPSYYLAISKWFTAERLGDLVNSNLNP